MRCGYSASTCRAGSAANIGTRSSAVVLRSTAAVESEREAAGSAPSLNVAMSDRRQARDGMWLGQSTAQ